MTIIFRTPQALFSEARKDLARPHSFAAERVGFFTARATWAGQNLVILAEQYLPVADKDYVDDPSVGARIGQEALRKMLEIALLNQVSVFHAHAHFFPGKLWFSRTDLREQLLFVPDFFKVRPNMPHGAIVLNSSAAAGRVWLSANTIQPVTEFNTVGSQVDVSNSNRNGSVDYYA